MRVKIILWVFMTGLLVVFVFLITRTIQEFVPKQTVVTVQSRTIAESMTFNVEATVNDSPLRMTTNTHYFPRFIQIRDDRSGDVWTYKPVDKCVTMTFNCNGKEWGITQETKRNGE